MTSPSTPSLATDEGYETREVSNAITEEGIQKDHVIEIFSVSSPEPVVPAPEQIPNAPQHTERLRRRRKSFVEEVKDQQQLAREALGPPIAILPKSESFGINPEDVIDAAETIDQYTCAFEISRDTHFLDEVKKVMQLVADKNPYIDGSGLTSLYKFAHGDEINVEIIIELVQTVRRPTGFKAECDELERLHVLLRESQIYLPPTNVIDYIRYGCLALRSSRQVSLDEIKALIAKLPEPKLSVKLSQVAYKCLLEYKECQEKDFATWKRSLRSSGTQTSSSDCDCSLTVGRINNERSPAWQKFRQAWVWASDTKWDRSLETRFLLMCDSMGKSTETDRCLEREKAWENFWESIANHDPTGELSLLNKGIDHGAEEGSSDQTEK